jgi:hypothetical protein
MIIPTPSGESDVLVAAIGTLQEAAQCSSEKPIANIHAAFLGLHLTRNSTAYLEVRSP